MSCNMASRPATVQMAVTSENQDFKGNMNREELDSSRAGSNSPKTTVDGVPKKKGTFKITSVKLNDTATDGDSMDDLDESHTEMTEDYSSEILDMSRNTDYGQETPSATEDIPINNQVPRDVKEKTTDMHSRFRVVKIETKEPFKRGRWLCHDFLDPQSSSGNNEKSETKMNDDANSGSSSAGSSIHYVHGVDDPAKNPLLAGATGTIHTHIPEGQATGQDVNFQPIHPAPNTAVNPQNQVSTGYCSDAGQGHGHANTSLCQSHSQQSISSIASTDKVQMKSVSTGQSLKGEHGNQILSGQNMDNANTGMFMPHYSSGPGGPGSSISLQSVYPSVSIHSTSHLPLDNTQQQQQTIQISQGQTSTYQTYVHLGQQIPNPGISQSGHSETMPSSEINANIPHSKMEANPGRDLPLGLSTNEFNSGAVSSLAGVLDKDLNVIQNPNALSPALAAAVGDLQSPTEEDKRKTTKEEV